MAKKLLNSFKDPPTASSSDEDEVETSFGEDDEQISDSSSESEITESDSEVVIFGGDLESPNWFEKSFLVRFIASFGMDEYTVKQKWSKVPVETKKRLEEKWKLLEANENEFLLMKTDFLKDVTSLISEAI